MSPPTVTVRLRRVSSRLIIILTLFCLSPWAVALGQTTAAAATAGGDDLITSRPDPEGVPTRLEIAVFLVDLESIDDLKQEFTADLYLVARWSDPRLSGLEGSDFERILSMSEVWHPDLAILNRRGVRIDLPRSVRVDAEGNVEYTQRIRAQFASPLDLREFPFDSQTLAVELISYRYSPDELEMVAGRALRQESLSLAGWRIGHPVSEVSPLEIQSAGRRAGITLRLEAERERTFYLLTMVLPLVLIALMAWSVFWIDPSLLPSQLAISTASVFTLIAFRLSLMWSLPKVSYLTRADSFVLIVTLLVFAALGETVIAGRFSKTGREELAQTMDQWSRWIYLTALLAIFATILISA